MIIQIRGTSGSGKTTVMREVMASFPEGWTGIGQPGRKKPLYYRLNGRKFPNPDIWVLGHYEATCGGCDNIGSAAAVYNLVQSLLENPAAEQEILEKSIILCEGLLLSEDSKWTTQMADVKVLFLNTTTEECLNRVKKRRIAAGNEKELNPSNTTNRVDVIARAKLKLDVAGITTRWASSRQAARIVLSWINGSV